MKTYAPFLLALACLLTPTARILAQAVPAPENITTADGRGDLVVGQARGVIVLYHDIKNRLIIRVQDRLNPCVSEGIVRLASDDCLVEDLNGGGFNLQPVKTTGKVTVVYEVKGVIYEVGDLPFSTLEPNTADLDFQAIYPNGSWKEKITHPDNYSLKGRLPETNPDFSIFMPFPMVDVLKRGESQEIQAHYFMQCEAEPEIFLEGKNLEVEKLKAWNEFRITPVAKAENISLAAYKMEGRERVLLGIVNYGVSN
ncbi:MAG: hypothetical protein H6581_08370 [Bacteroidia bacterium]|nr:hypothetical protein [Bacteroidia bacterium]